MDARERLAWEAYLAMEPQGGARGDLQAGILASTFANVHRGADTRAFTPHDFMPSFFAEAEQATSDDEEAAIRAEEAWLEMVTTSLGGAVQEGVA